MGGVSYPFPHPRNWGGYFNPGVRIRWLRKPGDGGSEFDGVSNRAIWGFLGEPPNEAILGLRDPQNRARDQDSIPKGPKISSYGPFLSHLVRISSQIEPSPTQATWEKPGYGFWLFFQLGTLDFEGSKKAPETSFLDS